VPGHIETSGHGRVGASAGDGQDPADVLVRDEGVPEVHEEGGDAARVPLPGVAQFRIDVRVEEELGHREANRGGRGLVHRPQFGEGRLRRARGGRALERVGHDRGEDALRLPAGDEAERVDQPEPLALRAGHRQGAVEDEPHLGGRGLGPGLQGHLGERAGESAATHHLDQVGQGERFHRCGGERPCRVLTDVGAPVLQERQHGGGCGHRVGHRGEGVDGGEGGDLVGHVVDRVAQQRHRDLGIVAPRGGGDGVEPLQRGEDRGRVAQPLQRDGDGPVATPGPLPLRRHAHHGINRMGRPVHAAFVRGIAGVRLPERLTRRCRLRAGHRRRRAPPRRSGGSC